MPSIEEERLAAGYVKIPDILQTFFNDIQWIHTTQLVELKRWLNDCPYCKLRNADE